MQIIWDLFLFLSTHKDSCVGPSLARVNARVLQIFQAGLGLSPSCTPGGGAAGSPKSTCIHAANIEVPASQTVPGARPNPPYTLPYPWDLLRSSCWSVFPLWIHAPPHLFTLLLMCTVLGLPLRAAKAVTSALHKYFTKTQQEERGRPREAPPPSTPPQAVSSLPPAEH